MKNLVELTLPKLLLKY